MKEVLRYCYLLLSVDEVVLCYYVQAFDVLLNILYEFGEHDVVFSELLHEFGPFEVFHVQFGRVESLPVDFFPVLQKLHSTLKVDLVLVEAARLRGIGEAPLHTEDVAVSLLRVVHVLRYFVEQLGEGDLTGPAAQEIV